MYRAYRILVVDDNHLIRRLLDLILEGAGYVPVEAESGEDALALAPDAAPDLWIVDEMMPGMRGSDLIREIRGSEDARLASVPIIGLSGRSGGARELLAAGATAFVSKPIEEAGILAAVARALSPDARRSLGTGVPAA
jgi:CheY-like chemotaxis protein